MPRMSIYVPDDLKGALDQAAGVNWSQVAQLAFVQKLNITNWPKEPTMDQVIERIRQTKQEQDQLDVATGKRDGMAWAMSMATYRELRALSQFDDGWGEDEALKTRLESHMIRLLGDDYQLFEDDFDESPEYVEAYAEGALEVWNEVKGKI